MSPKLLAAMAWKLGIRKKASWYLRGLNYTRKTRINGVSVSIPAICGISCSASEPWMVDVLAATLRSQGGVFLDVGVNRGQTLIKVKALDPNREYIGLEPNPACVFYTRHLIEANSFRNCTLLPVGLFTRDDVLALDLFSEEAVDPSASLITGFRPDREVRSRVFVPVFQFETLAGIIGHKRLGIIKIDVEGAELEVISSLLQAIRRDQPIILIEILPVYAQDNAFRKNRQDELERIFAEVGYALLRIQKTPGGSFERLQPVEEIGVHSDLTQCDYVVVPKARLAELQMEYAPTDLGTPGDGLSLVHARVNGSRKLNTLPPSQR